MIQPGEAALPSETLSIVDNRTGREYSLPIVDGAIRATDLAKITGADGDGGLMSYDPAYLNTSSCRSAITYIDGDAGILRYRGYPIEQVAESATFLETAYLLHEGELPTAAQLRAWEADVRGHTYVLHPADPRRGRELEGGRRGARARPPIAVVLRPGDSDRHRPRLL